MKSIRVFQREYGNVMLSSCIILIFLVFYSVILYNFADVLCNIISLRYITVEITSSLVPENKPLQLKSKIFHDTLLNKIQQLHGDFGVAAVTTGFLTKYCNENTRIAIIRARHGPHRFVTSSIPFVTKIGKLDVRLNTLHVGATLKHSFKFIQKHQRAYLDLMWSTLKTDEEKQKLEAAVMDFTKTDVSINIDNIA